MLALALLSGGGVASCLAAINQAQARQCCSSNCPDRPAHNPNRCCSVAAAQDAEVAPAAHSSDGGAIAAQVAMAAAPYALMLPNIAASRIFAPATSPPLLASRLRILCSLQL